MSPQSTGKTTLKSFRREFFVQCGRRGGRPRLSTAEKTERAIQRLERRLIELRACRTRASDSNSEVIPKSRTQCGVRPHSARVTPAKAAL